MLPTHHFCFLPKKQGKAIAEGPGVQECRAASPGQGPERKVGREVLSRELASGIEVSRSQAGMPGQKKPSKGGGGKNGTKRSKRPFGTGDHGGPGVWTAAAPPAVLRPSHAALARPGVGVHGHSCLGTSSSLRPFLPVP